MIHVYFNTIRANDICILHIDIHIYTSNTALLLHDAQLHICMHIHLFSYAYEVMCTCIHICISIYAHTHSANGAHLDMCLLDINIYIYIQHTAPYWNAYSHNIRAHDIFILHILIPISIFHMVILLRDAQLHICLHIHIL